MTTDSELLTAYQASRSAETFAEIVSRHGAMVYRTCLRTLADLHAAEDATQATFLLLAREPASVRGDLSCWLYFTARRTAYVARRSLQRRLRHEQAAGRILPRAAETPDSWQEEVQWALGQLPDRLREVLVLRYLEGHTQEK